MWFLNYFNFTKIAEFIATKILYISILFFFNLSIIFFFFKTTCPDDRAEFFSEKGLLFFSKTTPNHALHVLQNCGSVVGVWVENLESDSETCHNKKKKKTVKNVEIDLLHCKVCNCKRINDTANLLLFNFLRSSWLEFSLKFTNRKP